MDIGSSFTFMFDDEDWIKKIAIGGVVVLVGQLTLGILLLPVLGYMLVVLKNVRDGHPRPLPEWTDFGDLFMKGVMALVILLAYGSLALIALCPAILLMFAGGASGNEDIMGLMTVISMGCLYCVVPLFALIGYFMVPAALIRYVEYGTLGAAFQFRELFEFISANISDYVIAVLLTMAASFVASFGTIACFIGVFFTNFWAILVSAHLYGQMARVAK